MVIMDNQPESYSSSEPNGLTYEEEVDMDPFGQCMKDLAAKKLKKLSLFSQSKTPEPEEPTTKISSNPQDVDLVKPQPQRRMRKTKKKKTQPIWIFKQNRKLNLKYLDKYPNSYFMVIRCNGCFFVSTIHSHPQEQRICPMCCMTLCVPSKTPGEPARLRKATFWRKTEKIFSNFVYGPLPPN